MVRKLLLASLGCLCVASAVNAGNCRGGPCHYITFGADRDGCLEIRNSGREDVEITVYTGNTIPVTLRVASGITEKVYKTGRKCVLAADYIRSDAQIADGSFKSPNSRDF